MKLGKVVGRVVSTRKLESIEGVKLLLVQPLNEKREPVGDPLVATDGMQAGEGDIVLYEGGKEAAQTLPNWFNPVDAAVIGIADAVDAGRRFE